MEEFEKECNLTFKALMKARKAFENALEKYGYDPAYWDIRFTAYLKDSDLKQRLTKIEYESELKEEL